MALWDSADLLERCIRNAKRPASDASMAPADWFAYLTEAQQFWVGTLATMAPDSQIGAPVQLVSSDSGYTYDFPWVDDADHSLGRVFPVGQVEIRATRGGQLLVPGAEWSDFGDFVAEGDRIRIPGGRARLFPNGPWARFVTIPEELDATHEPVLKPRHARTLLVARACANWARRGGQTDPQPYLDQEHEAWFGAPDKGVTGLLGMFKSQYAFQGNDAIPEAFEVGTAWWRGMRTD